VAALVALAGAGAGFLIGGPAGAATGQLIGEIIGNVLFPPQKSPGPRLTDLTVQSSAMGAGIPISFGTLRMAGNIIWSPGITEVTGSSGGLFKGGVLGVGSQPTYTYYCSFAISFGEGPAADVLRMWADGKLFYDKTGASLVTMPGLNFKFYPGDDKQLPDPTIEAVEGVGNVPAYRGQVLIVFDQLPLAPFGNHVPNITAEIAFETTTPVPSRLDLNGSGYSTYFQYDALAVDWTRRLAFSIRRGTPNALGSCNVDSMTLGLTTTSAEMGTGFGLQGFNGNCVIGPDGYLYTSSSHDGGVMLKIDPVTLSLVASAGGGNNARSIGFVQLKDSAGALKTYVLVPAILGDGVVILDADDFGAPVSLDQPGDFFIVRETVGQGFGTALRRPFSTTALYRVTIAEGIHWTGSATVGYTEALLYTFAGSDFGNAGTGWAPTGMFIDPADGKLVIASTSAAGSVVMKWDQDANAAIWRASVPSCPALAMAYANNSDFSQGTAGWIANLTGTTAKSVLLNLADGTFTTQTWTLQLNATTPANNDMAWDSVSQSLICCLSDGATYTRLFFGRALGAPVELGDIVTELAGRVGLASDDLDVSELTDMVQGFTIARQMTAAQAIQPLSQAFFFDAVESDYLAKFKKRPQAKSQNIPEDSLGLVDTQTGQVVKQARQQELEIPATCSVTYIDPANDYQQGSKGRKRPSAPKKTMHSSTNIALQLPVVLTADQAMQIAEVTLYTAWLERDSYSLVAPWDFLTMDPADVVEVDFDDGSSVNMRVSKIDLGADYSMQLTALSEDEVTYASAAAGGPPSLVPQVVPGPGLTKLVVFDLPLLRDVDSVGASASRVYFAAGPQYVTTWAGCALLESSDGVNFVQVGADVNAMSWGVCKTVLPDNRDPWSWDNATELVVYPTVGAAALENADDVTVLGGANALAIIQASGAAEVVQFGTATHNADGSVTLSHLLRGRRGTDIFCGLHAAGELYVLLSKAALQGITVALTDRGLTRYWKGVGAGMTQASTPTVTMATNARDLMPYSVVHESVTSTGGGSPDYDIAWVRRTRLGGEWVDLVDAPLSEASELYEVDILSGPGGTLKRTLGLGGTLSTPAVTYANADIVTDFGSPPAELTIRVYQISAAVGRGMTRETTLEVA